MIFKTTKLLILLGLVVLVTGCQEEYRVSLAKGSSAMALVSFDVERITSKEAAQVHTIRLYDQNESLVWHLEKRPDNQEAGVNHVRYGFVPRGFDVEVPATDLRPGSAYSLVVQGSGYGVLRFVVDARGEIVALKHELSQL